LTKSLLILSLIVAVYSQELVVNGPLYAVAIAPTLDGISLNTYDLSLSGETLVGFAAVENGVGIPFTDSGRLALDRNRGVAHTIALQREHAQSHDFNVTLISFQYMRNNELLTTPEELNRCIIRDIFMITELFMNTAGDLFGILRMNGFPNIIRINNDCTFVVVKGIAGPTTRVAVYKDLLYFVTAGGLNQVDLTNFHSTLYPIESNRRWGMASYIALDHSTGTIYMTNTNGNFGDRRFFTFTQARRTIKEQAVTGGLITWGQTEVFNVNGRPYIGILSERTWTATDAEKQIVGVWTSGSTLNAPDSSDWRFHTLSTN